MFREMRRFKQQLPIDECKQILTDQKRCVLSVLGDDGYPYGIPMDYVYDPTRGELGSLFFHCAVEGHKLDAIAACDKASVCVMDGGTLEEGSWWYHVRSVICFGRAAVVDDEQLVDEALRAVGAKYFPPEVSVDHEIAKSAGRVRIIELRIEHMSGKHVREN